MNSQLSTRVSPALWEAINTARKAAKQSMRAWLASDPRLKAVFPDSIQRTHEDLPPHYNVVTPEDWDKGIKHVAELLGITKQAVYNAISRQRTK